MPPMPILGKPGPVYRRSDSVNFIAFFKYLFPLLLLIAFLKSSFFKGFFGEFLVNVLAKFNLDKSKYHLIKNVTLPTEDGTTQIDHIIVSQYGIFVVETKNLKGWIFGSENQPMWTQKIFKHTNKFQNPLRQNYKHIKTLDLALKIGLEKFCSLIVFVGDSKFKTPMPENVTYGIGYIRYIKSKTEQVLDTGQVNEIVQKIEQGRLQPSLKTHIAHAQHVKAIIQDKQNNICPRCGSQMVIRVVKKGINQGKEFWGCPNFPKCRYSKDAA